MTPSSKLLIVDWGGGRTKRSSYEISVFSPFIMTLKYLPGQFLPKIVMKKPFSWKFRGKELKISFLGNYFWTVPIFHYCSKLDFLHKSDTAYHYHQLTVCYNWRLWSYCTLQNVKGNDKIVQTNDFFKNDVIFTFHDTPQRHALKPWAGPEMQEITKRLYL